MRRRRKRLSHRSQTRNVGVITDAPDARECGLVEGGGPISARHKRGALAGFEHRLLGDGSSRDGVCDEDDFGLTHNALEVNVGLVACPLPPREDVMGGDCKS